MSIRKQFNSGSILRKAKKALFNQSGSVKILTGLSLFPMLLFAGVAIDTAELHRARVNFQVAVDAATVVTARSISRGATVAEAKTAGREVFHQNIAIMGADTVTIDFPGLATDSCADGGVATVATMRHKLWFDAFHGFYTAQGDANHANLKSEAVVKCGNETVEIALVLDNSGSMGRKPRGSNATKMQTLKAAAVNMVETLHTQLSSSPRPEPVKFSLVPFAGTVNIDPSNRNQPWMDNEGLSSIHWGDPDKKYFYDWDMNPDVVKVGNGYRTTSGTPISRFTLYDNLQNVSWGGCVEARPYPHNVEDTTANAANPETLIVPTFAPDEPDNWNGQATRVLTTTSTVVYCTTFKKKSGNSYVCSEWSDGTRKGTHPRYGRASYYSFHYQYRGVWRYGTGGTTTIEDGPDISGEEWFENNYIADDHNYQGTLDARDPSNTGSDNQHARQAWTTKYFSDSDAGLPSARRVNENTTGLPPVLSGNLTGGPNLDCMSAPIIDLTAHKNDVIDGIQAMDDIGTTNIQQGAIWGWRTLSPGAPFTSGRSYTAKDNKKIMIMMSDGANTYYNPHKNYSQKNKSVYGAWGMSLDNRIFDGYSGAVNPVHSPATFQASMNEQTILTCENIKKEGIVIYSIAFNVTNGSTAKTVLDSCASPSSNGGKLYYDAADSDALVAAFKDIAEKITDLAITQ